MKRLITICIEKNEKDMKTTNNSTNTNLRASSVGGLVLLLMLAWTINVVAAPAIVTNFPIPSSSACSVAVNPSLNKIYVSGGASPGHNVIVIDGSTFAQTTVGTGSGVLSVDTVSDRYWAGTVYGGSVIVRDGVTNATVINKGLGYCPIEADVDSVHRRVWVGAQCGGDMVWAIDADTFATIAGPISTGGVLGPIRVNPVTGRLYVYPSGVSKRVNPTTFAVTTNAFGWVAGVNPVANRLYAVSGSTLQIIDGAPDPEVILASVPLPFITIAGYPIGVNTALNRIYISSHADYSLYTLDGTTGAGLGSVSLGTGVSIGDIAVDSTNGRIYMITSTPIGPQLFVLQDVPVPNSPPIADAGANIQIPSSDQNQTTIQGTATDPEGDPLEYRWLDGAKVILDWSPVGETGEAYLNLGTLPYLSVGNHTLTLEVREAKEGGLAASDEMILTVQNSPPQAQPAPSHQVVEIGIDLIVVVADVADSDGDTVTYQWLKGSEVLASGSVQTVQGGASVQIPDLVIQAGDERFPVGLHQIELTVSDGINNPVSAIVSVEVKDTKAPSLIPMPSVTILWPPNHELQPVTIAANAFDNGGGAIHLDVSVQSSQPPDSGGDGHTIPDYYIDSVDDQTWIIQLRLRSERAGTGDGRTYKITITATDVSGNNSIAIVEIRAPHDKRKK